MITLSDIAAQHSKWIAIACKAGLNENDANDVVQEMYLYFAEQPSLERYEYEGKINEVYIYHTVRSKVGDFFRNQKRRRKSLIFQSESKILSDEQERSFEEMPVFKAIDIEKEQSLSELTQCIQDTFSKMQLDKKWRFGHILFTLLTDERNTKINIKRLSEETGINKHTLYNERKKVQQYLCEQCEEAAIKEAWTAKK